MSYLSQFRPLTGSISPTIDISSYTSSPGYTLTAGQYDIWNVETNALSGGGGTVYITLPDGTTVGEEVVIINCTDATHYPTPGDIKVRCTRRVVPGGGGNHVAQTDEVTLDHGATFGWTGEVWVYVGLGN